MLSKISKFLLILFFLIPALIIIGPFLPDLIISLTVIFSIFVSFFTNDVNLKNSIKKDYFGIIFLIFFFYLLLNSFINFIETNSFTYETFNNFFSRSLFLFRFILYPFSLIFLIKKFNLEIKKEYLIIFIITFLFVIFDTIIQYFVGVDIFGYVAIERGQQTNVRLSGPFGDELIPGSFLMRFFFITLLFLFFIIKKSYVSYALILVIILTLVTILMTGERAALILSFFGVFILFLLYKNLRLKTLLACLSVIFFSAILLLNNPPLKKRIVNYTLFQVGLLNISEKSSNLTLIDSISSKFIDSHYGAHWETGYRIWTRNKLFGVGLKQFRYECAKKEYENIKSALRSIRCATHPHNTYVEVFSETGIVGFVIFLLLIHSIFKKIMSIKEHEKLIKLPMISLIMLFWPLITTGSFFTNMTLIYLCFLLTVIFMMEERLFKNLR